LKSEELKMVRKHTNPASSKPKLLTEVELELMQAVWSIGSECTVKDVQAALPQERDLAYTSVATMLKILEQKSFLTVHRQDRALTYSASISRSEYEATSLKHMAENVFQGSPGSMVMKLLNEAELSKEELQNIRNLLNQRLKP
jgi:predicted transcriptional regulator